MKDIIHDIMINIEKILKIGIRIFMKRFFWYIISILVLLLLMIPAISAEQINFWQALIIGSAASILGQAFSNKFYKNDSKNKRRKRTS